MRKAKSIKYIAIHNPIDINLLSMLRLKFSHLNKHKFCHNFKDATIPMCDCGSETQTTDQLLLCSPSFAENRQKLLNELFKMFT